MAEAWRVPFARFLKETAAAEQGRPRFYLHWVDRWLASTRPDDEPLAPGTVARYIDQLARDEEPAHVQEAKEAIRLFSFF